MLLLRWENHPPVLQKGWVHFLLRWRRFESSPTISQRWSSPLEDCILWGCKSCFGKSMSGQVGQRCERKERKCLLLHQAWHTNWSTEQRICLLIFLTHVIPATFLWHSEHSLVLRQTEKLSRKGKKVLWLKNPRDWAVMHIPAESEMCA